MYRIYTDSSYHEGKHSWSFVINYNGQIDEQYGVFKQKLETIQEAEFKTVFVALYYAYKTHEPKHIDIYTDNKGVVNYMQGNCRLRGLFHIQKEIFRLTYSNRLNITYNHVHGHSGVKFNEIADSNARKAFKTN